MAFLRAAVILSLCAAPVLAQIEAENLPRAEREELVAEYLREHHKRSHHRSAFLAPRHAKLHKKALRSIEDDQNVVQSRSIAQEARRELLGSVDDVLDHADDAAQIKHSIAQKQAQIRKANHKTNSLKHDVNEINMMHSKLVKSLHKNSDPKVNFAAYRMNKKDDGLKGEIEATKYWSMQTFESKAAAAEMITQEKDAQNSLSSLQAKLPFLLQQEQIAQNKFHYSNQMAAEEVASLQYAEKELATETAKLNNAKEHAKEVHERIGDRDDIRALTDVDDSEREILAEEDESANWKDNVAHIKEQADEMLKENQTAYANLLESETQLEWTQNQTALAAKEHKIKQGMASQEIAALKHAKHQFQAEESKLKVAETNFNAAKEAVQKLHSIRDMEQKKLDRTNVYGVEKLRKKMKAADAYRATAVDNVQALEGQYSEWKGAQAQRSKKHAIAKASATEASQAYQAKRQETFDRAQEMDFQEAEDLPAWENGDEMLA